MKPQHRMQNHHVGARGLPLDPWMRIAEARRLQAEAIAEGGHRVWTRARRTVARSLRERSHADTPAPNGSENPTAFVARRYSLGLTIAESISRGVQRLVQLVRGAVLESFARRGRRSSDMERLAAMDDRLLADIGLRRSEIEWVVDPPRGDGFTRRALAEIGRRGLDGRRVDPADGGDPTAAHGF